MVYMNPWTKTECAEFADAIHLEAEEWLPRFNLVGGRPRLLFASPESLRNLLVRVEAYIFSFSLDDLKRQVNLFQTEVFDNRLMHALFTIYRGKSGAFYLENASLGVKAILNRRFGFGNIDTVLSNSEKAMQSWREKEVETQLIYDMACNRFFAKPLDGGDSKKWDSYRFPATPIHEIEDTSEIEAKERMIYVTLSRIFPAIDAIVVKPQDRIIFYVQATVSKVHPIRYQRLKDIYLTLEGRSEFRGFKHVLLFMVSNEMFDEFTFQPYRNEDQTIRTEELDIEVTQYVGKSTDQ